MALPLLYNISNFSAQNTPAEQLQVVNAWSNNIAGVGLWIALTAIVFITLRLKSEASDEQVLGISMVFMIMLGLMLSALGLLGRELIMLPVVLMLILLAVVLRGRSD